MLLLLLIILIIITGLLLIIIPMILIINILLFEYGMTLSCDCVLTVFGLSSGRSTPTETNSTMDETFEFLLFYQEECAPCWATNKRVISLGKKTNKNTATTTTTFPPPFSLLHLLLILPKEGNAVQTREMKFYICNRGDCFVCTTLGFEIFQTFQKPESQVSYLYTCSLTMVRFWFWKSN